MDDPAVGIEPSGGAVATPLEAWATCLAVVFMRAHLASQAGEWALVERKAVRWLRKRCSDVPAALEAAAAALGLTMRV